ncbi:MULTISPECIES: hypothetical protein [Catellatospora]|uniref:Uncharacterized protein n=2 Tax=Catellatospora TaxID=53365 RepID=A0A8J3KFH3_9ACTN|nr:MULTISPECIES: hypothetical protein [Catellatospora]RKE09967.1 hypothetical protein C8E86_4861 [Catellatospora citrea]GIF91427.1 hypothetical protein Cch02nite_48710 [Catellatospora chokoriensis]GIG01988.1 hypothetical protein Cci01nite_70810 [Catellatospora citrea]
MGRIVKQLSDTTTKYYWYPGEKQEWIRAVVAVGTGGASAALLMMLTRNTLAAVVTGCAVTLAVSGFNFGRRDAKALSGFPNLSDKAARRAAISHSGRAAWRASAHGVGGAVAAIVVLNLAHHGWVADWLLPVVPAVVGALAHQTGMIWEQLASTVTSPGPAATPAAKPSTE